MIYQTASEEVDYHDAALLVLMWYLLGRSSDMALLSKGNVTVSPSGSVTLRFGRVKTGVEQGLALYGDKEFLSCPIHALAMAAVVERVPSDIIFRHLPKTFSDQDEQVEYPEDLLLSEVFQQQIERAAVSQGNIKSAPSIHSYVNRTLRRIVELAKYSERPFNKTLTSHSFRRGGAQAANASSKISLQWILDRGGWQLSSLNRGFIYIFNTTTEDQQVAKVLSGFDPEQPLWQPRLDALDATTRMQIGIVQAELFSASIQPDMRDFSFKPEVLDVFMAHLLLHYPDVCERLPRSRYQVAVERALSTCGYTRANMLGWSLAMRHQELNWRERIAAKEPPVVAQTPPPPQETKLEIVLGQHMEMMRVLLEQNAMLAKRLAAIESRVSGSTQLTGQDAPEFPIPSAHEPVIKRRRAAPMTLTDVWMLWFTSRPPLYDAKSDVSKQRFSDFKLVVAYMRMFLTSGYSLGSAATDLTETRRLGAAAEVVALRWHHSHCGRGGGRVAAYGTVLKSLKELHAMGALDSLIAQLRTRIESGAVTDPTPPEMLLPTQK